MNFASMQLMEILYHWKAMRNCNSAAEVSWGNLDSWVELWRALSILSCELNQPHTATFTVVFCNYYVLVLQPVLSCVLMNFSTAMDKLNSTSVYSISIQYTYKWFFQHSSSHTRTEEAYKCSCTTVCQRSLWGWQLTWHPKRWNTKRVGLDQKSVSLPPRYIVLLFNRLRLLPFHAHWV